MANGWVAFPASSNGGVEYALLVAGTGSTAPLWWWHWDARIYSVELDDATAVDVPDGVTAVTSAIANGPAGANDIFNQDWCYDPATGKVWAVSYVGFGSANLFEIDPSDGSYAQHAVTDVDRVWIDGSNRLWIRRDTDLSLIERIDKADPTAAALETRDLVATIEHLVFVGADAYATDGSSNTLRWFPDGGSLQTLAVTSSGPYLRFLTHDPDRGSLWIMTGGTTGATHYLHEFDLTTEAITQDVTLSEKLTQTPPMYYNGALYFWVGYHFGGIDYRGVQALDTSDNSFTELIDLTTPIYDVAAAVLHPNGRLYLIGFTNGVSEWGVYSADLPAGGDPPAGGGVSVIQTVLVGQLMKRP